MPYLLTHGDRNFGVDPVHTAEGIEQLRQIVVPKSITNIVVGTGRRFKEILQVLAPQLNGIPVETSPFCGSADGLEADGGIIHTNGSISRPAGYMGLVRAMEANLFDPWRFIFFFPPATLFLAGGELYLALGLDKALGKAKKAGLYYIDPADKNREVA